MLLERGAAAQVEATESGVDSGNEELCVERNAESVADSCLKSQTRACGTVARKGPEDAGGWHNCEDTTQGPRAMNRMKVNPNAPPAD